MSQYVDFEIEIDPPTDNVYGMRVRSATGQDRDTLILPINDARYTNFKMALEYGTGATENQVVDFGMLLYETLLKGKIWGMFTAARDRADREGKKLRIKFSIDPTAPMLTDVAAFPWEFACDDVGIPLATDHSFCRFLPRSESLPALKVSNGETLKVLLASALPSDLKDFPLDIDAEIRAIRAALKPLEDKGRLAIVEVPHLTGLKLQRAIREERPHIVHYVGHGAFEGDMGALVLEKNDGTRQDMSARTLATTLRGSTVRLVVLNACKTGMVLTNLLRGMAPALMGANIPAVVAMQSSVQDDVGLAFAEEFYRALASGEPIDGCVAEGRKAIITCGLGNLDWGLATLYMRAPDGMLFEGLGNTQATTNNQSLSNNATVKPEAPAGQSSSANVSTGSNNNFSGATFKFGDIIGGNVVAGSSVGHDVNINKTSEKGLVQQQPSSQRYDSSEMQHLIKMRGIHTRNLRDLEEREGNSGANVSVQLMNQLKDAREKLAQIEQRIKELGG